MGGLRLAYFLASMGHPWLVVVVEEERRATALAVLTGLFVASLTASNYLASKITAFDLFGFTVAAPAAVLAYALTFAFTDVISEVYGRRTASRVVAAGFLAQVLVLAYNWFALELPYAPFSPAGPEEYRAVVGASGSVIAASLTAYVVSQSHDVWAFHWWRERTRGRWLWLRNNASTMVSQLLDTVIFISLAFHVFPAIAGGDPLPWSVIGTIIVGQYLVKVGIAALDTPLVYLLVALTTSYIRSGSLIPRLGAVRVEEPDRGIHVQGQARA